MRGIVAAPVGASVAILAVVGSALVAPRVLGEPDAAKNSAAEPSRGPVGLLSVTDSKVAEEVSLDASRGLSVAVRDTWSLVEQRVFAPAPAPDGSGTTYTMSSGDDTDLVFVRSGESQVRKMTTTPRFRETGAEWSPDGSTVVYERTDPAGGTDLWVLDASTGSEEALVVGPDVEAGPRWSPDGDRVLFFRRSVKSGHSDLYEFDLRERAETRLTATATIDETSPDYAPDGVSLAYLVDEPEQAKDGDVSLTLPLRSLYASLPGGEPRRIADAGYLMDTEWISDDWIAVAELGAPDTSVLAHPVKSDADPVELWRGRGMTTFAWEAGRS